MGHLVVEGPEEGALKSRVLPYARDGQRQLQKYLYYRQLLLLYGSLALHLEFKPACSPDGALAA